MINPPHDEGRLQTDLDMIADWPVLTDSDLILINARCCLLVEILSLHMIINIR